MAYVQNGALAIHEPGSPGSHIAFRVSDDDRTSLKLQLEEAGIEAVERDHEVAVGLFFRDPDGRLLEAITYRRGDDPRRA